MAILADLNARRMQYASGDAEQFLDAAANARLVKDAEVYYRAMYCGSAESCNVRDRHMFDTLCQLLKAKGPNAKAIVWAHNSHIGDARYTRYGCFTRGVEHRPALPRAVRQDAALIGFGTHTGTVAAADDWDEPMQVKRVNPSRPDSYERLAHDSEVKRFLLDLRDGEHEELRQRLLDPGWSGIGVIYRPDTERWSHYSEASLPQQFDADVCFDETTAVIPLPPSHRSDGEDDTYPFGL